MTSDEFLDLCDDVIEVAEAIATDEDMSEAGREFAESVLSGARSMRNRVDTFGGPSPAQERAMRNWDEALAKFT